MSNGASDQRRLFSSTAIYAAAGVAQQGAGFLLIPVYTRLIEPAEYGVLELFAAFSSIGFVCLSMGLSAAINKCYHRDCRSAEEKADILSTAMLLDLPVLLVAAAALLVYSTPVSEWLTGTRAAAGLVPLAVGSGFFYALVTLVLAGLRAQERAVAFSLLTLMQFTLAMALNLLFVVGYGLGVHGVFWGNMLSSAVMLPVAVAVARRGFALRFNYRLVQPLLSFGLYLIPAMLAAWVMDLSDRYFLRVFRGLDEVAVYGVGYKFGMLLQVALVWPFQLAWPAFSFSISNRSGHRATYARTLTYMTAVLVFAVLSIGLIVRIGLPFLVGEAYRGAARIVPLVALAYAFNGIQYCLSPGIHLAGRTKYLSVLAVIAALINVGLNLLVIPRFGMIGAAGTTVAAFAFLALATWALSQRVYPVPYEYGRLAKVVAAGCLLYLAGTVIPATASSLSIAWHVGLPLVGFPAVLLAMRFFDEEEWGAVRGILRRRAPLPS